MLQPRNAVPHFVVETVDGRTFRYASIWQVNNLALVAITDASPDSVIDELSAAVAVVRARNAELVVTRETIAGIPAPGWLVADRWGEIAQVAALPPDAEPGIVAELLDWLDHIEQRCPECEGESR